MKTYPQAGRLQTKKPKWNSNKFLFKPRTLSNTLIYLKHYHTINSQFFSLEKLEQVKLKLSRSIVPIQYQKMNGKAVRWS